MLSQVIASVMKIDKIRLKIIMIDYQNNVSAFNLTQETTLIIFKKYIVKEILFYFKRNQLSFHFFQIKKLKP